MNKVEKDAVIGALRGLTALANRAAWNVRTTGSVPGSLMVVYRQVLELEQLVGEIRSALEKHMGASVIFEGIERAKTLSSSKS